MKTYSRLLNSILDFIYPNISILTDKSIEEGNSNHYINDDEISLLSVVTDSDMIDLRNKISSDIAFGLFAFREEDNFSKIIYQLKYAGRKRLGVWLGGLLGKKLEVYLNENIQAKFDYIIPVPLFKTKLRERGYNQSDFICMGINEILKIKFIPDLVKRVRHTSTQTKLNKIQRIENIRNAFIIDKKYTDGIYEKRIILVDDVVTTGSTMNELIKILKENNCCEIAAVCLAMAR